MKKNNALKLIQRPHTVAGRKNSFLMKYRATFVLFLLIPMIASCGSDGSISVAGGGIGGTGITSVGPITALGSIYVNGIEFETTHATVTLGGMEANEKELQVGMVVKVEGTLHADGQTGIARTVVFDENAQGPISSIDLDTYTLKVMGQTVLVDEQTVFAGLPGGGHQGLSDLEINDLVQISGISDADGNVRATWIAWKTAGDLSEVSGRVSNLTHNGFNINALEIDYSNAILKNFGSAGIQPADIVQVKGTLLTSTTLLAEVVERKHLDLKEDDEFEIEGFIESLIYTGQSLSGLAIIGPSGLQVVYLNQTTRFSGGQLDELKPGIRIEVEGTVQNSAILANKVEFKESIIIEGVAINPDSTNLSVGFYMLPAMPIKINHHAERKDERNQYLNSMSPAKFIDSINDGDGLMVRGRPHSDGTLIATHVSIFDPPQDPTSVILQGPVDNTSQSIFLEISGITINTSQATSFLDDHGNSMDSAAFFEGLSTGTLVKATGNLAADNLLNGRILRFIQKDD